MESYQKFDSNNEIRSSFSRFSINRVITLLTEFNPKFEDDSEEKFKNPEEQFFNNPPQESVLNQIMKGKQLSFINISKKEEFLSYENWKKNQESNNISDSQTVSNIETKFKELAGKVYMYLNEETIETTRRKSDDSNEDKQKLFENMRKKSSESEKAAPNRENWMEMQNKLSSFLQYDEFRRFFSEYVIEQLKEKSYLSMNHDCFWKFINIVRDLLKCKFLKIYHFFLRKSIDEQERKSLDYETIYNILIISSRIYEKVRIFLL